MTGDNSLDENIKIESVVKSIMSQLDLNKDNILKKDDCLIITFHLFKFESLPTD